MITRRSRFYVDERNNFHKTQRPLDVYLIGDILCRPYKSVYSKLRSKRVIEFVAGWLHFLGVSFSCSGVDSSGYIGLGRHVVYLLNDIPYSWQNIGPTGHSEHGVHCEVLYDYLYRAIQDSLCGYRLLCHLYDGHTLNQQGAY